MGVAVCGPGAASRVSKGILSPELITAASYDLRLPPEVKDVSDGI